MGSMALSILKGFNECNRDAIIMLPKHGIMLFSSAPKKA